MVSSVSLNIKLMGSANPNLAPANQVLLAGLLHRTNWKDTAKNCLERASTFRKYLAGNLMNHLFNTIAG